MEDSPELYRVSTFDLKRLYTKSGQLHFHQKWKGPFPPSTALKHSPQTNAMSGYCVGLPNLNQLKEKNKPIESHSSSSNLLKSDIPSRNSTFQLEIIRLTQCV